MPLPALALVLVAACTHATWNLLAKRAAGARHFVWLYSVVAVALWFPVLMLQGAGAPLGPTGLAVLGVSGLLHLGYSTLLQRSYRVGDLSVIYPTVRGVGPLLAFFGAMVWLDERPGPTGYAGALLVVGGVFLLAGGPALFRPGADRRGLGLAVVVGAFIAAYTLWDARSVRSLGFTPVVVDYAGNLLRAVVLTPAALRAWPEARAEASRHRWEVLGVGVLGTLGYVLVLTAMTMAPVSHVAPAREVSMLVGAWLGARMLGEGDAVRRLAGSGLILAGVVALAL